MSSGRTFLVEAYAPASSEFINLAEQARRAAGDGAEEGLIRHLRTILVPEDEICFHLYEAESADSVEQAIRGADMRAQRIVEVRS
jgi:hypothetical protein